ncbi:MAG: hypothetical protein ABR499_01790 [Gemmatimonadaceae bacterium]
MTLREFTDSEGVIWRVWNSTPLKRVTFDQRLQEGWLTFESTTGRKRLAPIPHGWEEASIERLELMCRAAELVPRLGGKGEPPDRPDMPDSPKE